MLQKSARFALAIVMALAMCPTVAFAADDDVESDESESGYIVTPTSDLSAMAGTDDLYEYTLEAPDDGFSESYNGALSSSGILKGWGRYLYYLHETPVSEGSSDFAFSTFERYAIDTGDWETLDSLPVSLIYASGCIWEGSFIVMGYDSADDRERIFQYATDSATGSDDWTELEYDVPIGAGIVNCNGMLMVVGGANASWGFLDDVYEFDTGSGLGEQVASLDVPVFCPQLAVHDSQVYIYSYGESIGQYNNTDTVAPRHLQVASYGGAAELTDAIPESDFIEPDVPAGMPLRAEAFGSIAATVEGLTLVGPQSLILSDEGDYYTIDTYAMLWDSDEAVFESMGVTASESRIYGAAACLHDNLLYAAAASAYETGHAVFRATGASILGPFVVQTSLEESDDTWYKGSDEPFVVTLSPDYSRFYDRVFVDDEELEVDAYLVEPGENGYTVIELLPEYLDGLSEDEHEMLAYFDGYEDGPGAEVVVPFTIEGSVDPDPTPTPTPTPDKPSPGDKPSDSNNIILKQPGYTRPTPLAMTGDLMLVVPFAALGAGAIAIGVYLVRRRIRNK